MLLVKVQLTTVVALIFSEKSESEILFKQIPKITLIQTYFTKLTRSGGNNFMGLFT